jgi:hypothetical protein
MATCQADLQIFQGDDYQGTVTVLDSASKPVDLTGYTVLAQIRIMPAQYWPAVAATITCTVTLPNTITLFIPNTVTINLYCTYVWDLQLTDATGLISTILQGYVYVEQDISRQPGTLQQAESIRASLAPPRSSNIRQQTIQVVIDTLTTPLPC